MVVYEGRNVCVCVVRHWEWECVFVCV